MLNIEHLNAYYEDSHILHDVSLELTQGERVCLLGKNGVGKTTTFKSIMGVTKKQGHISFSGREITALKPYDIAKLGIGYVPEDRRIFPNLTVHMNLKIAYRKSEIDDWSIKKIYSLFPKLGELTRQKGDELSGGEQQMLAIARALVANPKLILLDEPSEGLAPMIIKSIIEIVLELSKQGIAILIAEQNSKMASKVADRCYILSDGRIVYQGGFDDLMNDQTLKEKFLGVS